MAIFLDYVNAEHKLPEGCEVLWRISAYAVITNEQNQLLLVLPTWRNTYDFPGGGIETTETISESIARECYEETGYRVKMESIVPLHVSKTNFYHSEYKKFLSFG